MNLIQAIEALGDSKESLMQVLREKGIKGKKFSSASCPIARYLASYGMEAVVGPGEISVFGDKIDFMWETPAHVNLFVAEFDNGQHPEFEE